MKRKILTLAVVLALIAVMVVPVAVSAATVTVNGENVTNNAIQLAIKAAAPGDTISIGPGTYPEQLTITQSLTLKGSGTKTIIAPSTVSPDTTRYTNTVAPFTYGNASPLSPVILVGGSTFGTMSSSGCAAGGLTGYIVATEYTMPRAGTITSISVYAETSGNEYVGIYSNIPGTPDMPGALLVSSGSTAMIGGQWNTVPVAPTALTAGSYWITTNEDTDYMRGYVPANPNQTSYIAAGSYGALPSAFGAPTAFQDNNYVAYATYVTGSPITVNIQNLKIDGTTAGNSATQYFWDIVYQDASGAISGTTDLAVAASLPSYTLFGSDYGGGIFVQSDCVGGISNVNIQNNMVSNYYKSGIVCDGVGTTSNITGNTVTGVGPVVYIAQNGVQISRGAMATINNNQISGNNYSAPTNTENYFTADAQACGILLYNAELSVVVSNNKLSGNDIGINAVDAPESPASAASYTLSNNTLLNNKGYGIVLDSVNGTSTNNCFQGNPVGLLVTDSVNNATVTSINDQFINNAVNSESLQATSGSPFSAQLIVETSGPPYKSGPHVPHNFHFGW